MKAVFLEDKSYMEYKDTLKPTPENGEIRVKVKRVSICGSDIKRYISGHRMYPIILGHECAGVIEAVGNGVDKILLGKHASIIPLIPCFSCSQCERGLYSACENYSFIGSRQPGGFAEYLVLPEKNAFIMPEEIPLEHAALIEPSTVARHMLSMGKFDEGESAVVLGVGSIGLFIVQWLRIMNAKQIICIDISEENLEIAKKLGAHTTINPLTDNVRSTIQKITKDGVDVSFEAAGVPQTLNETVYITRPRGRIVLAGNQPIEKFIQLSFFEELMRGELSLTGNFMSFSSPFPGHEWTETLDAIKKEKLDMDTMISHRFSLSETPEIFAKIKDKKLSFRKIMLEPEGTN